MTIVVTGATGNVGRHVVDRLVEAGQTVRAMTRDPQGARLPAGVEVVRGDFQDPNTFRAALAGAERVYLFSSASQTFVEEGFQAGVRRFVVHSAAAAGFAPGLGGSQALRRHLDVEREAHRSIELAVEAPGSEWTHVRPGLLAVNALRWAEPIRDRRLVREPYATAGYPVVHEADIAAVAAAALIEDGHVGRKYTLAGPEALTTVEQVRAIGAAIGEEVWFEELDPVDARALWIAQGYPEAFVDWIFALWAESTRNPAPLNEEWAGVVPHVTGRPGRTFAQWAVDHAADFR